MSAKVLPYLPQVRQSTSYSLVMSDNVLHKDPKCPYPTEVPQGVMSAKVLPKDHNYPYSPEVP